MALYKSVYYYYYYYYYTSYFHRKITGYNLRYVHANLCLVSSLLFRSSVTISVTVSVVPFRISVAVTVSAPCRYPVISTRRKRWKPFHVSVQLKSGPTSAEWACRILNSPAGPGGLPASFPRFRVDGALGLV